MLCDVVHCFPMHCTSVTLPPKYIPSLSSTIAQLYCVAVPIAPSMSSPFLTRFAPVALLPGVWCACAGIPIGIFVLAPPLVSKVLATMYSCWYLYDFRKPFTGGWALQFFRRLKWWDLCREYFPYELHLEDGVAEELKLKASKKEVVIFCTHPHGVLCAGLFLTFGFNTEGSLSRKVPDLVWRVMTIKATFFVPLWREFTEALGFIDASR